MPRDRRAFADPNGGMWRSDPGFGIRDPGFGSRSPSSAIGSGATAAASLPGSTIVSPARYRTSNRAAVRVPAIATRTRNPRSAAVRRSSSAIVRASPNNRVRPLRSSTISVGLHTSIRGENSRATSASTSGGAPSIVDSAPNTDHLIAVVCDFLIPAGLRDLRDDRAYAHVAIDPLPRRHHPHTEINALQQPAAIGHTSPCRSTSQR